METRTSFFYNELCELNMHHALLHILDLDAHWEACHEPFCPTCAFRDAAIFWGMLATIDANFLVGDDLVTFHWFA